MFARILFKATIAGAAITALQAASRARAGALVPASPELTQVMEKAVAESLTSVASAPLGAAEKRAWQRGALTALRSMLAALSVRDVTSTSLKVLAVWTIGASVLPVVRLAVPLRFWARRQLLAAGVRQAAYVGAAWFVYRRLERASKVMAAGAVAGPMPSAARVPLPPTPVTA